VKISPLAPKQYQKLPPLNGIKIATINAGIKYQGRDEMMLLQLDKGSQIAGVYTRSQTAAAPVVWCRNACADGGVRAILVNAGNANACTGERGLNDVKALACNVAEKLQIDSHEIMVCSTGVIGEFLPLEKMQKALTDMPQFLAADNWEAAANSIMTTDTFPKLATRQVKIGEVMVNINGIAKGSGMIAPDMATLLAFIVTDAKLPAHVLQPILGRTAQKTFNSITVDGDTSTNDTLFLIATGAADNSEITNAGDAQLDDFKSALRDLMQDLAIQVIKDGEGATKLLTIKVSGAENEESARIIGLSIANSPLVKTALAAADPNWGRIIAAIGKSGRWINEQNITLYIGDELVVSGSNVAAKYLESNAKQHMLGSHVNISVDVGVGTGEATVWTCDLTEDYIKINASYRS
jgi:glutamate N-acetyltransferase / amino-acid N-acetyltransferase